jgi:hypothetical protein
MRTDDERLGQSRKAIVERIEKLNAVMLTVIEGHLIVEQAMDGFLEASIFYPEPVRENRFNFSHKAHMCRSWGLMKMKMTFGASCGPSMHSEIRSRIARTLMRFKRKWTGSGGRTSARSPPSNLRVWRNILTTTLPSWHVFYAPAS